MLNAMKRLSITTAAAALIFAATMAIAQSSTKVTTQVGTRHRPKPNPMAPLRCRRRAWAE